MPVSLPGIHHVTSITRDVQKCVDFYVSVLGLRFVKKSINQDVPDTYHIYFGDYKGSPGTAMTFFGRPRGPAEERHRRARRTLVIAEIDVIGVRNVLVDALLDEAQAEHTDVEVDAFLNVAGDRGHVVNAGQADRHQSLSLVRARTEMTRGFVLGSRPDL